jgi:hypothetical protein
MICVLNPRLACFVCTLALVAGCHAKKSLEVREQPPPTPNVGRSQSGRDQSPLSPIAQEIQRRGYEVKERLTAPPTSWEVTTLRLHSKRSVSFRANQPQGGAGNYFVRFWFFEETYDSIEDAEHRLANLHLPSPDADAEVNEYGRVMRSGFRVGTVVYFLQTDAIVFWDDMQRFAKEIFRATPGAELFTQ